MAATVSNAYADNTRKRSVDWLISVRDGDIITIMRYSTQEAAEAAKRQIEEAA